MQDGRMKAVICTKYGPPEVLVLGEVEKPFPKDREIRIRIYATVVSSGDCRIRSLNLEGIPFIQRVFARLVMGVFRPRNPILGLWLAGEVEMTGSSVQKFKVGDKVYARTPDMKFGAYGEYVCLSEKECMTLMPTNLTYQEAVSIPFGGVTALYFLTKNNLRAGQKIMIYGASGAVGSAAVQLAKHYGAEVTGVCSTANLELVRSLGADHVIDYTKEDYAAEAARYDVIFDTVGKIDSAKAQSTLKPAGKYISIITSGHARFGNGDLDLLTELAETGAIRPVIDRTYPLEQMAEAHRYVDGGHKKGNVVISIGDYTPKYSV